MVWISSRVNEKWRERGEDVLSPGGGVFGFSLMGWERLILFLVEKKQTTRIWNETKNSAIEDWVLFDCSIEVRKGCSTGPLAIY